MLHSQAIEPPQDHEIPVLDGISGTTRDIFQYCSTFNKDRLSAPANVVWREQAPALHFFLERSTAC
jgi:hypothetical protein